jgi:hypothetical protein
MSEVRAVTADASTDAVKQAATNVDSVAAEGNPITMAVTPAGEAITAMSSAAPGTVAQNPLVQLVTGLLSMFGLAPQAGADSAAASFFDPFAAIWAWFNRTFNNQTPTISFNPANNVTQSDGTIRGKVTAFDPDGDTLTFTAGNAINGGSIVVDSEGNFVYTPGPSFQQSASTDLFTISVTDDIGNPWHVHGFLGFLLPGWGSTATTSVLIDDSVTAAAKNGWGTPRSTNFTGWASLYNNGWYVYNGAGNGGYGTRTPDAISFVNNTMLITGDSAGNTGGLALWPGQQYGSWEVRVKVPAGSVNYHPVVLLWPDSNNWPAGGEMDFMEILNDPNRQHVGAFLHYSPQNQWESANVTVDATQWHNYAVSWTPQKITAYVDGVEFFSTTDTSHFPPGSMHLAIQLDVGGPQPVNLSQGGQMQVAWARQYSSVTA